MGDQSLTNMVLWFAVFFGIIYFIIIRPNSKQQKARRQMLDSLNVKDKIVTIGGIHGTVSRINEDTVMIKVANNLELEFQRSAIQTIMNDDYQPQPSSKGGKWKKGKEKDEEVGTGDYSDGEVVEANEDSDRLR